MNELTRRLKALLRLEQPEKARDVARERLWDYEVSDVMVNEDTATVYCGPYTGYHAIRRDTVGDVWATTLGSYVHDPSGVEFEAECPNMSALNKYVHEVSTSPNRGDAARATYRRTRM